MTSRFDTDAFVSDCRRAVTAEDPLGAVRSVVQDAVDALTRNQAALEPLAARYACRSGEILLGHDRTLYEDAEVTVVVVETEPGHLQPPHDHGMCAVIGAFEGAESNRFFRRDGSSVVPATQRVVHPGEVIAMREDSVHAISADGQTQSRALHVYLGALSATSRTLFHPDTGAGEPFDFDTYLRYVRPA